MGVSVGAGKQFGNNANGNICAVGFLKLCADFGKNKLSSPNCQLQARVRA